MNSNFLNGLIMTPKIVAKNLICVLSFILCGSTVAHIGHNHSHGDEEEGVQEFSGAMGKSLFDRVNARLGSNQLVVLHVPGKTNPDNENQGAPGQLVLFLDDYATAEPKTGASLQVSINFSPFTAHEQAPGIYIIDGVSLAPGLYQIDVTLDEVDYQFQAAVSLTIESEATDVEALDAGDAQSDFLSWKMILLAVFFLLLGYGIAGINAARKVRANLSSESV